MANPDLSRAGFFADKRIIVRARLEKVWYNEKGMGRE